MTKLARAKHAGWNAFFANKTAETCPHTFGTPACFAWLRGHNEAEEALVKAHGPNAALELPMEPLPFPEA